MFPWDVKDSIPLPSKMEWSKLGVRNRRRGLRTGKRQLPRQESFVGFHCLEDDSLHGPHGIWHPSDPDRARGIYILAPGSGSQSQTPILDSQQGATKLINLIFFHRERERDLSFVQRPLLWSLGNISMSPDGELERIACRGYTASLLHRLPARA